MGKFLPIAEKEWKTEKQARSKVDLTLTSTSTLGTLHVNGPSCNTCYPTPLTSTWLKTIFNLHKNLNNKYINLTMNEFDRRFKPFKIPSSCKDCTPRVVEPAPPINVLTKTNKRTCSITRFYGHSIGRSLLFKISRFITCSLNVAFKGSFTCTV